MPDPLHNGSDAATLRIIMARPISDTAFQQDSSANSVVNGFALLGGVWTFVSGAFAAIFGSTLLFVLFGMTRSIFYLFIFTI